MKILETSFRSKGFFHEQIYRKKDLAIYKRRRATQDAIGWHWEVIVIKSHNGYELAGKWMDPAEMYPGSESWGVMGWTLQTEEAAFEKLEYVKKHLKELKEAKENRNEKRR